MDHNFSMAVKMESTLFFNLKTRCILVMGIVLRINVARSVDSSYKLLSHSPEGCQDA